MEQIPEREIQYELLRPQQLIHEREKCPLVFLPVGPLEYHGPHLPVGIDPINAFQCAKETCKRTGVGVVFPPLMVGTERERPEWMLKSLGLGREKWVVGMDFPAAPWKSHYTSEHIFGLFLSETLQSLLNHDYRVIVIVNGHGAVNHLETIDRLATHHSQTANQKVVWGLAATNDNIQLPTEIGHADAFETSLMLHYEDLLGRDDLVDLESLPPKDTPIHYKDLSIVDGPGFSRNPHPDKVVQNDPRLSKKEMGRAFHESVVLQFQKMTASALASIGQTLPVKTPA